MITWTPIAAETLASFLPPAPATPQTMKLFCAPSGRDRRDGDPGLEPLTVDAGADGRAVGDLGHVEADRGGDVGGAAARC